MTTPRHEPVLLHEAIAALHVRPGGSCIDATAGLGGHSEAIIEAAQPGGRLLAIDQDQPRSRSPQRDSPASATWWWSSTRTSARSTASRASMDSRRSTASSSTSASPPCSSTPGRGFSFQRDEPLDMRMDTTAPTTAADIVNETDEGDLADLIYAFGEERRSRRIAHAIVARRPLHTTGELVNAVEQAVGRGKGVIFTPPLRRSRPCG